MSTRESSINWDATKCKVCGKPSYSSRCPDCASSPPSPASASASEPAARPDTKSLTVHRLANKDLPRIPETGEGFGREIAENYNKLADALRWFHENKVALTITPTASGYVMNFTAGKEPV